MDQDLRRAPRVNTSLPVTLLLRETGKNQAIAEPIAASLTDMSIYGIRITVPHIRFGDLHLFYSFNEEASRVITLEVADGEEKTLLVIPVHPVWYDQILSEPSRPFLLGMEFLVQSDHPQVSRLDEIVRKQQPAAGWLKRLFQIA